MCQDNPDKINNALHAAEGEDVPTVTLCYGPYMNWGRWNHNPSRVTPLINSLKAKNISVQLKHDDKETTWDNHGWVKIQNADGAVLAEHKEFQHNKFRKRNEKATELALEVEIKLEESKKEASAEKVDDEQKKAEGGLLAKVANACSPNQPLVDENKEDDKVVEKVADKEAIDDKSKAKDDNEAVEV